MMRPIPRLLAQSVAARVRGISRAQSAEVLLVSCVAVFATAVRLSHLEAVETGGDALNKWNFARQWFHDFRITEVPWDHHLSRLGVNLPLVVIQAIFGRAAVVYHLAALLASTMAVVLVYAVGRLAHGRAAGVTAAIWFALFPSWERAGSQVSPDSFGAVWMGASVTALLLYGSAQVERRRRAWLLASAFCLFGAYLAKEPLVFFLPGALLATYLFRRRWVDVGSYALVPLLGLGLETLFYRLVSPFSSRFSVFSSTHGRGGPIRIDSIWGVFGRYTNLEDYWYPLLVPALLGALLLPFFTRERRIWAVVCIGASFFFCYTFALRSLSPLALWTRFLARYLDAGVPFAALVAVLFFFVAGARVVALVPAAARLLPRLARFELELALSALAVAGIAASRDPVPWERHPLRETPRFEAILSDAYQRGIPIKTPERQRNKSGYKALKAAYSLYIRDELLVTEGKLPRFGDAYARNDVMVRPGAPPFPDDCFVEVWTRGRWLKLSSKRLQSPACR